MAQEQAATTQEKAAETTGTQVAKPPEETTGVIERAPRTALTTTERTSPFAIMRQLMDDMDRFFSGFSLGTPSLFGLTPRAFELARRGFWAPAIETFERDGRLVLRTELPGLRREDVNVEIAGDELVVSGERTREEEEARAGRLYSERSYGSFERRLTLPEGVNTDTIEASLDNGVLEISLAMPPGRKTRRIELKGGTKKAEESGQAGAVH